MDDNGVMGPMETLENLAPFLTKPVVNELCSGRKWADYRERKLELLRYRVALAWWRQRRIAEYHRQREYRFVDGIGQFKASIDPMLVGLTRSKYRRLAFHDPDHLNYILKEHPELRVPTPKPRYLMVNGFRDQKAERRSQKSEENPMKLLLSLILVLAIASQAFAGNVVVTNPKSQPVPVTSVSTVGGAAIATNTAYATHITTSTTATPTSSTAYLNSIVITTTNAGTTWALKIQNKEGTPKVIYNITAVVVGTVTIPLQAPLLMTSGIDIITTGATPGVLDVFLNYSQ